MRSEIWQVFKFGSTLNQLAMMGEDAEQQAHAAVNATIAAGEHRLTLMGIVGPTRLLSAEVAEVFHKDKPQEKYWQVEVELESLMPIPEQLAPRIPIGEGVM